MRATLTALVLLAAAPIGIGTYVAYDQFTARQLPKGAIIQDEAFHPPTPAPIEMVGAAAAAAVPVDGQALPVLGQPMTRASERVTKKPFGIYVTPETSPVQPDVFTGFHSGVDFETFPDEQEIDVPVFAICSGPLIEKKWARGYGGVAVQRCELNGEAVVVAYGHVSERSVDFTVGNIIRLGDTVGVLGRGGSEETDGRRKHLHLGIHRGDEPIIKGYVANRSDLAAYIDYRTFLGSDH